MLGECGLLGGDAANRCSDRLGDAGPGALGWSRQPAVAPAQPDGPAELCGEYVELGVGQRGAFAVAEALSVFRVDAQLVQPSGERRPGGVVQDGLLAGRESPGELGRQVFFAGAV